MEDVKIFCEVLAVINALNVYVNVDRAENYIDAESERDRILVQANDSSISIKIEMCKGILLKPNSVCGLHFEKEWVSFRINLDSRTSLVNSVYGEIIRDFPSLRLNPMLEDNFFKSPVQLQCSCGNSLSQKQHFKMYSLPSSDWDLASEGWFCHLHKDHKNSLKASHLSPKYNECFYNELFVQVNDQCLLSQPSDGLILCKNCHLEIGVKKKDYAKFWINDIKWVGENEIISKTSKEIIVNLIYSLLKDSLGATSRFALEVNGNQNEFLYIMIMDKHLDLLTNQNTLFKRPSPMPGNESTPPKKPRYDELSNHFQLKKINAIKVLYKLKTQADEESGSWVDDVNVNVLCCGQSFFQDIFQLLETSNKCIPEAIRMVNELKVGYISKI